MSGKRQCIEIPNFVRLNSSTPLPNPRSKVGFQTFVLVGIPDNYKTADNQFSNANFTLTMKPHSINARTVPLIFAAMLIGSYAYSQPIIDGFTKGKGNGSLVVSYWWERYDKFYFADTKMDAPPP